MWATVHGVARVGHDLSDLAAAAAADRWHYDIYNQTLVVLWIILFEFAT